MTAQAPAQDLADLRRGWGEAYRITWDDGSFRATHIVSGQALDARTAGELRRLLRDDNSRFAARSWPTARHPVAAIMPRAGRRDGGT